MAATDELVYILLGEIKDLGDFWNGEQPIGP
jgi:hypothetical protein